MTERPHDKPNLTDKCYRTKDDKLHAKIFYRGNLEEETTEERERRLENIRQNKGTWVYDRIQKKVVRKEDCIENSGDIEAPRVSSWNPEWTVVSTGYRMSKGELKRYCRERGKAWVE